VSAWIGRRANALLGDALRQVRRVPWGRALKASTTRRFDYLRGYVEALAEVVDAEVLRGAGLTIGVDPLGGASAAYWEPIAERYRLGLRIVESEVDPTFRFMSVDHDGTVRMDPSSRYAMARLVALRDRFDLAVAVDPDADRHGIVTREAGLVSPAHFMVAAIDYLFRSRSDWEPRAAVGKTVVTSGMIDRVTRRLGRKVVEVPVGFKYFVGGLLAGRLGFAGEESAGATFLRRDGRVWTTDKDGIVMCLLAAEMTAREGLDPALRYRQLSEQLGDSVYERTDAPATDEQKRRLEHVDPRDIRLSRLGGEPVVAITVHAAGDALPIGGVKVDAEHGWFAARPSGTEAVWKLYAESFSGVEHLARIQEDARAVVDRIVRGDGTGEPRERAS
jgi:phosphoglucomutase